MPGSTNEIASGSVIAIPIARRQEFYVVQLDDGTTLNLDPTEIIDPASAIGGTENYDARQGDPLQVPTNRQPMWLTSDSRVMLERHGQRFRGFLTEDDQGEWMFEHRNSQGLVIDTVHSSEFGTIWTNLEQEGILEIGWDDNLGHGRRVSARGLKRPCPGFLWHAMSDTQSSDYTTWLAAHKEEYDALKRLETYRVITKAEVDRLSVTPIPTMNILTVKPDSSGNPLRAKSRTVVLGNEEEWCWEKTDVCAPVIGKTSARAFVSNGIAMGRITKQADAKNAFCHPTLPEDKICVVTPPKCCLFSKEGDNWLLQKMLYGLRRSPRHWYKALSSALAAIGLSPCAHDPCTHTGTSPTGSTTYVGIYVDDVVYYGADDAAELWFENELRQCIAVDFMGAVSWYLGVHYEWSRTKDGRLSAHLSQEAHVHKLLEKEQPLNCIPATTPYRSGTPIDRLPHNGVSPDRKHALVKRCQSVLGGCVWLSTNTRPDITACVSLLASHIQNPSEGHLQSARHLLRYLKGSSDWGTRYTSPDPLAVDLSESRLWGEVQWPIDEPPTIET